MTTLFEIFLIKNIFPSIFRLAFETIGFIGDSSNCPITVLRDDDVTYAAFIFPDRRKDPVIFFKSRDKEK